LITLCSLIPGEARADVHVDGERITEANRGKQHFCNSKRIRKTAKFDRVKVKIKNRTSVCNSVQAGYRYLKVHSLMLLIINKTDNGTKTEEEKIGR
jgi:hypothetical protein